VNDVQSSYLAILRDSVKTAERIHPPERVLDTTPEWNVLRETRTPTLFRTWTHDNGTAVSLSLKDYVYLIGDGGRIIGSFQTLLTVTKPGGGELVLWNSEPRNPYFGSDNIKDAEFSPLGSYFSYSSPGYEAYDTGTYDVRTGSAKIASRAIERGPGWPYWSPDEKRLAYLRWSSPIEGQVAEIMWSPTGSPENLRTVRRFDGPGSLDNAYFENVRHSGSLVTFEIQEGEGQVLDDKTGEVKTYGGRGEKFSFDLESGILSTLGTF
jgi:hypothetical protein